MTTHPNFEQTPQRFTDRLAYIDQLWRYRECDKRDLRLDLLRGFCLFVMIVDHIGGFSPLHAITGGNTFFISAAEGFVFISGLLFGQIYRKLIERNGFTAAIKKSLHRAWKLYLLTFILTISLGYVSWWSGKPWIDHREIADPWQFVMRVLALRNTYRYTDILVMYALLVLGAPIALALLRYGWTWVLLCGSWVLWLLYQIAPESASQPLPTINSFHPAAWQIFFVHAMAIGYHRRQVAAWFNAYSRTKLLVTTLLLSSGLIVIYLSHGMVLAPFVDGDLHAVLNAMFLKNPVRIGRILAAVIMFPLAYLLVTHMWLPLRRWVGWLLLPLGQHSLYSYIMHLPLIIVFAVLFEWPAGVTLTQQLLNAAIQLLAIFTVWTMIRQRFLFRVVPQ